jgi:hypothetical protein
MKKFYVWKSKRHHPGWSVRHGTQFAPFGPGDSALDNASSCAAGLNALPADQQEKSWLGLARCYIRSGRRVMKGLGAMLILAGEKL